MKLVKHFLSTAAFAIVFLLAGTITAQSKAPQTYTPFSIDINATNTDVTLECTSGCAWKTLTFSIINEGKQWVDASGLTKKTSLSSIDKSLAPFNISFNKLGDTLELESTKGAAWEKLSLNGNARFTMQINEFGLVQ